jgi:hypothetical protein
MALQTPHEPPSESEISNAIGKNCNEGISAMAWYNSEAVQAVFLECTVTRILAGAASSMKGAHRPVSQATYTGISVMQFWETRLYSSLPITRN